MEVLADGEGSSGRYKLNEVADGGMRMAEWSRWLGSMMWRAAGGLSFCALVGLETGSVS